jgi:amidase
MTTPAHRSATSLIDALRRRELTAVELTEAAISAIESEDTVNAVVVRDFDRARSDARAAEKARLAGDDRPLLGIPTTVKESFDLRGHPTTWGLPEFAGHRADRDAVAVRRLKEAGAVVLGKTNVPTGLGDWQCENPIYGRTINPHDGRRTSGGSSGGGAAALSLGLSALELGTDMGGSLRVPAAFCGIYSHKPTWGLVPQEGMAPGGRRGEGPPLAAVGPMARTPEDLAIALNVLTGAVPLAPFHGQGLMPARHGSLRSYRVLIVDSHPAAAVSAAVRGSVHDVARRVSDAGGRVASTAAELPDAESLLREFRLMLRALGAPDPERPVSAHDWFEMCERQRDVRLELARLFENVDVVVMPAFGVTAFPHDLEPDHEKRTLDVDGRSEPYEAQLAWAALANYGNLPATTMPVGFDPDGLPLAVQVVAPHREDLTGIEFARMLAERDQ